MESSELLNKTKPSDFKIYGRLISYVLPYFPQFLISILGFAVFAGSQVAFAEWLKRVIDYVDNPSDDLRLPAIRLNRVVLPDPFGPIIPVIEPSFIFNEQFDTAAKPPKYFDKLSICRMFDDCCM